MTKPEPYTLSPADQETLKLCLREIGDARDELAHIADYWRDFSKAYYQLEELISRTRTNDDET